MSDHELRDALASLHPPSSDEGVRARALHRATLALDAASRSAQIDGPATAATLSSFKSLRFAIRVLLGSAAALALGFWLSPPTGKSPETASDADARIASLRLLAEVQSIFPGRLNAVIDRDGALQIDLADNVEQIASDQAIVVELARADRVVRILGFSGRAVDLEIGGRAVRFAPLLTGEGKVLLAGEDFAWTDNQPAPPALAGWRIEARPL